MRLKDRIAQAFTGSGKKSGGAARRGVAEAEENASPLVPKRLLKSGGALPGSARPRADTGLRDLTASGTVRAAPPVLRHAHAACRIACLLSGIANHSLRSSKAVNPCHQPAAAAPRPQL